VARLESIVNAFDGVMVARGDLGVELPLEQVPLVQKRAIQLCREQAKPVIVATQMLDSMIENARPTRAEASDVANAVLDGADAVMLSGETSVGKYPIVTVQTMARIVRTTEAGDIRVPRLGHDPKTRGGAITQAASNIARAVNARALVAFSQTGDTVRRLARLHCELPLLAFTPDDLVRNQLTLSWGVETFLVDYVEHTDAMFRQVDHALLGLGRGLPGDLVVVVAGTPANTPGSTNTLRIHQLGSLS
jgi:pyruvate kinase